jgi:hypothetical protein
MNSIRSSQRSAWREFSFILHTIEEAIDYHGGLQQVLLHWQRIAQDLGEAPRKRPPQMNDLSSLS